ncbi:MAG: phosphatase PAP2 family protein, partial [Bacteroidales bacterium]|nr:phosphatase PAP2 family protein [Bacteroidales bacterium]
MKQTFAVLLLLMTVSLFSQNPDINLLRKVHSAERLSSDGFFRFLSNSDTYVVTGTPVAMAITGLAKNDDKLLRNACVTAVGTAVSFGITTGLKYIVNRDRPFITYPEDIANKTGHNYTESVSFPSGHTTTAFATATALSLEYP